MVSCNVNIFGVQGIEFLATMFTSIHKAVGKMNTLYVVPGVSLAFEKLCTERAHDTTNTTDNKLQEIFWLFYFMLWLCNKQKLE